MQKNNIWIITLLAAVFTACGGTKPTKLTQQNTTDRNTRLLEKGVSFFAYGQEPFWNLEVYEGKEIKFEGMNNQSFVSPSKVELPTDSNPYYTIFRKNVPNGAFQLVILHQPCTDLMSGEKHPKWIIAYNGTDTLKGCGMNIYDKRINGNWKLVKIKGKKISSKLSPDNIPHLEINGELNTLSGSTGCNRFNGKFVLRNYKVHMGDLVTTKMACQNTIELAFLDAFKHIDSYQIKENNLFLTNKLGVTCEFIKTE